MIRTVLRTIPAAAAAISLFLSGCASLEPPDGSRERYAEIMGRYPQSDGQLRLQRLTAGAARFLARPAAPDVFIIVHPGYAFFFNGEKRERYRGEKFRLLELQFGNEARFIAEQAGRKSVVILIVPGNYRTDSVAPLAYTSYLNGAASAGQTVFYIPSETSSNGTIAPDDMVTLYRFIQDAKADKVLVGGGYIGRCQREFYNQLTTYYERAQTYLVREISTISPDDVSEKEASFIVSGILQQDYTPVGRFLARKLGEEANVLSIPPRK